VPTEGRSNIMEGEGIGGKVAQHAVMLFAVAVVTLLLCNFTEDVSQTLIRGIQSKFLQKRLLDDSGVPIVDYGYVDWVHIGKQRNPVTISQKALEYFREYGEGQTGQRQLFLNCANWLLNNSVPYDNYRILEYKFPWPVYGMKPPWRSGMAQGQALQVMIRAHSITGDEGYLRCGEELLNAFFVEVEDGGVAYRTSNDGWWYEEYAGEGDRVSRALNGMMFALLGIREYYEYTGDPDAEYLFEQGVLGLKRNLPAYDRAGASLYDILGKPAEDYHEIHVWQLERLYELTDEVLFREYSDKWGSHGRPYLIIRLLQAPLTKMEAAVLISNFVGLLLITEIVMVGIKRCRRGKKGRVGGTGLSG
jgi:heparosan-N-sulfate-glucuronate 5-epimerase